MSSERGSVRRRGRLAALAVGVAMLAAGCQLDADVGVNVTPDGSGAIAVQAVVAAEVVAAQPALASTLQFADATAAGWTVTGPTATDSGGLQVTIIRPFATVDEANALLASIGPPLSGVTITRTQSETSVVTEVSGSLSLPGGSFDAFADADLLATLGGAPFAAELEAAAATPETAMSVDLRVELPGSVESQRGGAVNPEGAVVPVQEVSDVILWRAPLDGSTTEIAARAVYGGDAGGGSGLPSWVRPAALGVAAVWLLAGLALGARMVQAQRRRQADAAARRSRYADY